MTPRGASANRCVVVMALVATGLCLSAAGREILAAGREGSAEPGGGWAGLAYHLRVVRVTGASAPRGAGLGCEEFCGTPIILPSEEAWGTADQITALARVLGGERADAVTGFLINADGGQEARFKGTVYPGETWVELRFAARGPKHGGDPHEIELVVARPGAAGPPLAEAHILARAERTVAIAAPSPIEGEWIVLAVTPMDPDAAQLRIEQDQKIQLLTEEPTLTPPTLTHRVSPVYPEAAKEQLRTGRIIMKTVIDAGGVPRAIRVLSVPPGCEDLASAAVETLQQWRYQPATLNGRPAPMYLHVTINFVLH